jgi:hypothetical protein
MIWGGGNMGKFLRRTSESEKESIIWKETNKKVIVLTLMAQGIPNLFHWL